MICVWMGHFNVLISWTLSWEIYRYSPMLTPPIYLTQSCYSLQMCLNGTLQCVDFMDVIMGDIPLFPHVNAAYIFNTKLLYLTMCLNGTLQCVDFMDVIMGDIPLFSHVNTTYTIFNTKSLYQTTLYLNGTRSWCVEFMDVFMGDMQFQAVLMSDSEPPSLYACSLGLSLQFQGFCLCILWRCVYCVYITNHMFSEVHV